MTRTSRQALGMCLSLSVMITSLAAVPRQAEGKAKLGSTKMSLTVGQSRKIKIKKKKAKAKYTFSSSAKAKATVSKKGVVKARKVGKAKITVKEKYKKKITKIGKVTVRIRQKKGEDAQTGTTAPTATPTAVPTATLSPTSTATAIPTATPTRKPTPTPFLEDPDMAVSKDMIKAYDTRGGGVEEFKYQSTELLGGEGESIERRAMVALPAGYNTTKKYPVVYALHGFNGAEVSLVGDGKSPGDGAQYISWNAAAEELAKDVIVVCPNINANKSGQQQVEAYDNFINDLTKCLMPAIEEHYSVLTGRKNTAIWGFSMGGRESLQIGFSRPDLFGYIGGFCPAPGIPDDLFKMSEEYSKDTLIIIAKGANDDLVGDSPVIYKNAMEKQNIPHLYYETMGFGGGGHSKNVFLHGYYNLLVRAFPAK